METHTIDGSDGTELSVAETGDGRPILLVHGYSQSRLCWQKQFDSELAEEFRLVAPDLSGHGQSGKPRDSYDETKLWADDLRAVITELDLDDIVLVGWSYAGLIVLDYVEHYGTDRLSKISLAGAIASIGTESANSRLGDGYVELVPGFVSEDVEESVETMSAFVELCVNEELSLEDHYFMLGYNVDVPPHVRDSLRARATAHEGELEEIDVPVLLTHGQADAVILPKASEEYADILDDAELSRYPDIGHSPFWEAPERFNRELAEFARK